MACKGFCFAQGMAAVHEGNEGEGEKAGRRGGEWGRTRCSRVIGGSAFYKPSIAARHLCLSSNFEIYVRCGYCCSKKQWERQQYGAIKDDTGKIR